MKWRDYDPQQYFNWRAYLDFGGGQVTDLFTHWLDVVHMFMGSDIPTSAQAAGGVYQYKDGRTAPDTINVLLEYPAGFTATFEATLVPGITGAAQEFCGTEGRLWIDRSRYEFYPVGRGVQPTVVKAQSNLDLDHIQNFLECVKSRATAERRRAHRPPVGAGVAPGQHFLHAEAADRLRPGARGDSAVLITGA